MLFIPVAIVYHCYGCTFVAPIEDTLHIYLASEICCGGEFFDTIANHGRLDGRDAARLFRQILSAVIYIHGKSICHRDLKPENFLVSKKAALDQIELKLTDFGTAKNFRSSPMVTKVCTANYVAPEVLKRGDVQYTEKVVVFVMHIYTSLFQHVGM